MLERTGLRILLTGASAGIGAELARILARRKCKLVLTARRVDRLESLANECRALGGEATVIAADLADRTAPARVVASALATLGGLDVLVNNAGFGLAGRFVGSDAEELARQIEVNLVAPILLTHAATAALLESRGTIINIGSSISIVAIPAFGVYGTTKAGLAYWNDALRREVAPRGIKVCLVEPGPVQTEFLTSIERRPGDSLASWETAPPAWASATAEDAARRIARLIDHPKRRISMLRRVVWPMRAAGAIFRIFPGLADMAVRRSEEGRSS